MEMSDERWRATCDYLRDVFGHEEEALARLRAQATEAGLPEIAVSADVGRLLQMLARMIDARVVVEVGTLGGYSALWLARALPAEGRLHTIELDERHAAFAEQQLAAAGLADRATVHRGAALDVLPGLVGELEEIDLAFVDAVKTEYPGYFAALSSKIRPGGLFIADNILGTNAWWIDDGSATARAMDSFNREVAADARFESVGLSQREGLLVARRLTREAA